MFWTILFWTWKAQKCSETAWYLALTFPKQNAEQRVPIETNEDCIKTNREIYRPNLLLADIVFDVFSEDGSQGSTGGDGEYLYIFFSHSLKKKQQQKTKSETKNSVGKLNYECTLIKKAGFQVEHFQTR